MKILIYLVLFFQTSVAFAKGMPWSYWVEQLPKVEPVRCDPNGVIISNGYQSHTKYMDEIRCMSVPKKSDVLLDDSMTHKSNEEIPYEGMKNIRERLRGIMINYILVKNNKYNIMRDDWVETFFDRSFGSLFQKYDKTSSSSENERYSRAFQDPNKILNDPEYPRIKDMVLYRCYERAHNKCPKIKGFWSDEYWYNLEEAPKEAIEDYQQCINELTEARKKDIIEEAEKVARCKNEFYLLGVRSLMACFWLADHQKNTYTRPNAIVMSYIRKMPPLLKKHDLDIYNMMTKPKITDIHSKKQGRYIEKEDIVDQTGIDVSSILFT